MATGWDADGRCQVGPWRDVVAVAAGWRRSVGLLADGVGQCHGDGRHDAVHVAAGAAHTLGLYDDGTVSAAGGDAAGRCAVTRWVP